MRDLNEDLDEQFREAVDRYTLRPVEGHWDELSGKITSIKRPSSIADPIRSKYRRWMTGLAFLLLLPVAYILIVPGFNGTKRTTAKKTSLIDQKHSTENVGKKTNGSNRSETQVQDPGVATAQGENSAPAAAEPVGPAQTQTVTPGTKQNYTPAAAQTGSSAQAPFTVSKKTTSNDNAVQLNQTGADPLKEAYLLGAPGISSSGFSEPSTKQTSVGLAESDELKLTPIYAKTGASAFEKESGALTLSSNKNLPLQHLDIPRRQGFYLGLVGGPLLTQVKNQGLKKSGFDLGLLAGYTLSKKFSIETGVLYTHQYYYVSGKYYNEFAGINYAASLEGSRNAFEIPLTVKYNLIRRAGGNFFITAGTSTFVGVSDKVVIQVAEGAIPPAAHFDYGVTSYLPSYVNVSIGYEYKIGKSADIRLEPYLQIPLNSNTGNSFKTESSGGSIQVFNAGIHIGISRFIR